MMRLTVVTGGHLSTCPRMLKAADALHAAGHRVRVISTASTQWAVRADESLRARPWSWERIDYTRSSGRGTWLTTGARTRGAMAIARRLGPETPPAVAARVIGRTHDELVDAILRDPGDLVYGGTRGAIAAVVNASRSAGVPCGVDFEDFHCGEDDEVGDGAIRNELSHAVMREALGQAAFVTAGSEAIADACERAFGRRPVPINNVFPLPASPAWAEHAGPLRLYWFSQTIGPGRGIEEIIDGAGLAGVPAELHLRGAVDADYARSLTHRAWSHARRLELRFHEPAPPGCMVDACRAFDAGVSVEQGHIPNRALNLPNKALIYPLAGLALVLTSTPGQQPLVTSAGGYAVAYRPGDLEGLAAGLTRLCDPAWRRESQAASWEAARTRWHWEHPLERDALLRAVEATV